MIKGNKNKTLSINIFWKILNKNPRNHHQLFHNYLWNEENEEQEKVIIMILVWCFVCECWIDPPPMLCHQNVIILVFIFLFFFFIVIYYDDPIKYIFLWLYFFFIFGLLLLLQKWQTNYGLKILLYLKLLKPRHCNDCVCGSCFFNCDSEIFSEISICIQLLVVAYRSSFESPFLLAIFTRLPRSIWFNNNTFTWTMPIIRTTSVFVINRCTFTQVQTHLWREFSG